MNKNVLVVLVGNKARNGKDTLAQFIQEEHSNTLIFHWASHLKEELTNKNRTFPLIKSLCEKGKTYYLLFDKEYDVDNTHIVSYNRFFHEDIPSLDKLMKERKILTYWGMDEKDSPMLQVWGTDYRRDKCDKDYWVNLTRQDYKKVVDEYKGEEPLIIAIPDTRLKNEYFIATTEDDAVFAKVKRFNEDGTPYIDPTRDPNHISETDLDDIDGDIEVAATTGDMEPLRSAAKEIVELAYGQVEIKV